MQYLWSTEKRFQNDHLDERAKHLFTLVRLVLKILSTEKVTSDANSDDGMYNICFYSYNKKMNLESLLSTILWISFPIANSFQIHNFPFSKVSKSLFFPHSLEIASIITPISSHPESLIIDILCKVFPTALFFCLK